MSFPRLRDACRESPPAVFVVLGSGLGPVAARARAIETAAFAEAPGLPASSVAGHKGALTLGEWAGARVLIAEGRLHAYEGHAPDAVARPIRLAAELGARFALLTNAAGGIRDDLGPGSLMPIAGLLEWDEPSPWRAVPRESPVAPEVLAALGGRPGVYAVVTGPTYETPAEVRALRACGADAVGMSTNRELRAGAAAGMRCGAVSLITNRAAGLSAEALDHGEVIAIARRAAERMGDALEAAIRTLTESGR